MPGNIGLRLVRRPSFFGDDLTNYLEEIYRRALRLSANRETMQSQPIGEERGRIAHEVAEDLRWLTDQLPELKIQFAPYMKFAIWK